MAVIILGSGCSPVTGSREFDPIPCNDGGGTSGISFASGDADDFVITSTGVGNEVQGEEFLQFDGNTLLLEGDLNIVGGSITADGVASGVTTSVLNYNTGTGVFSYNSSGGGAVNFLRADGTWVVPAGIYVHPNHSGQVTSIADGATILTISAITDQTALTTGLVSTDELLVNNGGILNRMDISVIQTYMQGALSYGTVTSITAGNGMDFSGITTTGVVTMGTPSTLTPSSTNATTTTSHGHVVEGFVEIIGTPLNNQIGVWTGAIGIEGDSNFTWGGSILNIVGSITNAEWNGDVIQDLYIADDITLTNITQITNRSHTNLSDIGSNTHAQIDTHIASTVNPHGVVATDVITLGTDNQIPVMNGTTDFDYSANLTWDSSTLTIGGDILIGAADNIYIGSASNGIYSDVGALNIYMDVGGSTAIRYSSTTVFLYGNLRHYNAAGTAYNFWNFSGIDISNQMVSSAAASGADFTLYGGLSSSTTGAHTGGNLSFQGGPQTGTGGGDGGSVYIYGGTSVGSDRGTIYFGNGSSIATLQNDDTETNLVAYDTTTGLLTHRTVSSISGSGDVTKVGTPVNNQIGVWTGDGTIEGDTNLQWNTSTFTITGGLNVSGSAVNFIGLGSDDTEDHLLAIDDSTGLLSKRSVASISASGYWTRTGTDLSPTIAGDDILLADGEDIHFVSSDDRIVGDGSRIRVYIADTEIFSFEDGTNYTHDDFWPISDNYASLGSSSRAFDDIWAYEYSFKAQTEPASPTANTGDLWMSSDDEKLYFKNSTTTYGLGIVEMAEVTLVQSQIQSLNTTPVTLVIAPGTGYYVEVISASAYYDYTTVAFSGGTYIRLKYHGNSVYPKRTSANFIADSADRFEVMYPDTTSNIVVLDNNALLVTADADSTGGNNASTIKVTVLYRIIGSA